MEGLRQSALDAVQITSLVLVFVTMFFGLRYPAIIADLDVEIPDEHKKRERKALRRRLLEGLLRNWLAPAVLNAGSLYLLLPLAIRIMWESRFALWGFDVVLTGYLFVSLWVAIVFVWSIVLGLQLLVKINSIKAGTDLSAPHGQGK